MKAPVDLYDSHYDRLDDEVYRSIRSKVFGVDLGQESWITAEECDRFCDWLGVKAGQRVLEVACGSGGVATRIAQRTATSLVGTDINALAIVAAKKRVASLGVAVNTDFRTADANSQLPFPDRSFDAVVCNDAINHFGNRRRVLQDWGRVLRVGGRCLFTDPVVVTGFVSNAELAARSSIGFFLFSVPGANEGLLRATGFEVERAVDVTAGLVQTSRRWREARAERRKDLVALETDAKFEGIQSFLAAVHALAVEGRLSRFAYVGRRTENAV
jgi:cyclopropane fatty-acyl-phospholipid synthase-like methyltransferase